MKARRTTAGQRPRGGADRRPLGEPAGGLGAAARDRSRVRRPTDLRVAQVDHVRAGVLLLLRTTNGPSSSCAFFLGRAVEAPQVRRVDRVSKSKLRHTIPVRHRDEVEPPITDWLAEAYELCGAAAASWSRRAPDPGRSPENRRQRRRRRSAARSPNQPFANPTAGRASSLARSVRTPGDLGRQACGQPPP